MDAVTLNVLHPKGSEGEGTRGTVGTANSVAVVSSRAR